MRCRKGMGSVWWHRKFVGYGYRLTVPREAILEVLSNSTEHLSAEDIYIQVHKKHSNVGLTTVYRTLDLLVQMGILVKFDFGDKRARFEFSEGPVSIGHHHHLVCSKCGRVINYTDFIDEEIKLLERVEKGLSKKFNFTITNHLIQFYGLCEKCTE